MQTVHDLKEKFPNINMADATFLRWHEVTNAVPHSHMVAFARLLEETMNKYKTKIGKDRLTPEEVISCFMKSASKLALKCSNSQFNTVMYDEEDSLGGILDE